MKIIDVKILWARSGNRCGYPDCRIELTYQGARSIVGEMAHIISDKPDGPRGNPDFPPEEIDAYGNRILLCPTHHEIIDDNPSEFTVERVHQMKNDHERWVTQQLDRGAISAPAPIDNRDFLAARKEHWTTLTMGKLCVITTITPLDISEDHIDPLEPRFVQMINDFQRFYQRDPQGGVDPLYTTPSERGIVNESLSNLDTQGIGHSIHVFRNGHCEFLNCIEGLIFIPSFQNYPALANPSYNYNQGERALVYEKLSRYFENQLISLKHLWDELLPFNDMSLSAVMINTTSTRLAYGDRGISPRCVSSPELEYNIVIDRRVAVTELLELVVKRFVNYFGLVIDRVFRDDGQLNLPSLLST